jgi:hypothetical protein
LVERVRGDYGPDFEPTFDQRYLYKLARKIARKFPFEERDKVVNLPKRVSVLNVAQYPVDISNLDVFRERIVEYSRGDPK